VGPDASAGGLDDTTGEDDAVDADDLDLDGGDGGWLEEAADAAELDIGTVDVEGFEQSAAAQDGDEGAPGADELGIGEALDSTGLDSGEEGPEGPDEELRDADLPDLGSGEDDEADEGLTEADRLSSDEPLGLGWAAKPWTRVGAPVPIASSTAIACAARGALVAGQVESRPQELLRVDLEGGCQAVGADGLRGPLRSLAVDGRIVAAVTEGGEVFVSRDAGGSFEQLAFGEAVADVVVLAGAIWVRSRDGVLTVSSAAQGGVPKPVDAGGVVLALTSDGSEESVALVGDGTNRPIAVLRGSADGSVRRDSIPGRADGGPPFLPGPLAARGDAIAYATHRGIAWGSRAGGWRIHSLVWPVTALAFVEGGTGLVAAAYSSSDDTTGLVRLDDAGPPRVLALLGASHADVESDGRAAALACDDPRGVVWVAGGFGVAAFSTR
jgi:hypothetical protein